jgi:hypothetical protein
VTTLFLHDGEICALILGSGADVHLFWPRELINSTSAKAVLERGNKKSSGFLAEFCRMGYFNFFNSILIKIFEMVSSFILDFYSIFSNFKFDRFSTDISIHGCDLLKIPSLPTSQSPTPYEFVDASPFHLKHGRVGIAES